MSDHRDPEVLYEDAHPVHKAYISSSFWIPADHWFDQPATVVEVPPPRWLEVDDDGLREPKGWPEVPSTCWSQPAWDSFRLYIRARTGQELGPEPPR